MVKLGVMDPLSRNLYEETLSVLSDHDLSFSDVIWIGNSTSILPRECWESALSVTYNPGWGLPEVDSDLVVVGKDWWLSRQEYDGSEWWQFNTLPTQPLTIDPKLPILYNYD